MKQLLIVNSSKALNAGATYPTDLSGLQAGAIAFFELGGSAFLSKAPTKNFGIALGRPNGQAPFIIPEVDIDTLNITLTLPTLGKAFKRIITMPSTVVKEDEYTLIFVKKGAAPHERSIYTCTVLAPSTDDGDLATALKKEIENKLGDVFTVTQGTSSNDNKLTIVGKTVGDAWEMKLADELVGASIAGSTDYVDAAPTIGDKAYIQELASKCAAGKGFTDVYGDGASIYPGYPEAVENLTPNTAGAAGASTAGYAIFTLRFQVGRDSAKTRDEKVWQLVHIAVPLNMASSGYATIHAILPAGDFKDVKTAAIAAEVVEEMVNSSDLNDSV